MNAQDLYQRAIRFAAEKHQEHHQYIPGTNLPYVVHLSNVAMELLVAAPHTKDFDINLAIHVALLHDTLEDTSTTTDELTEQFGPQISDAVLALTKNKHLPKEEQMPDCLSRIKEQPMEVWAVKLADRITNLQAPPAHWTLQKKISYHQEANVILETLQGANAYLEHRLTNKLLAYEGYLAS
ncbi:HD domain-containing protein [Spirosoma terrae]|uniref:Bifunctional (P)ppGpp synthetase/guanosine-3',5'-bis(Diphosphate) 3'-pyrophosphohydrolase n=1 Tax=Spirosoma terrae TaxID=1968276 RepID=A0A6L9LDT2_9BACT|nr:HD domain-containing protein [Spirosoma terrae]NDU97311.1 bifunctional (p)ppGpp synthetase/guanosine-3',5'-bis(diphosphate) 3'-pyrophosphohydrolase [Spirosoma terrae]